MRAWAVEAPGPIDNHPLRRVERPVPVPGRRGPGAGVGLRRVPHRPAPGRGRPAAAPARRRARPRGGRAWSTRSGPGAAGSRVGDRVGIAWLRQHLRAVPVLPARRENLCRRPAFTGWDADGGYAEYAVVAEALRLPAARTAFDDDAGGAAAVRRDHRLPGAAPGRAAARRPAGHLRLRRLGPPRRAGRARRGRDGARADPVGARPGGSPSSSAPRRPAAPTTRRPSRSTPPSCSPRPATLVPVALRALDRGGTLAVAGIHLSDDPAAATTPTHLFQERELRSVTANTRADGEEFLAAGRPGSRSGSTTAVPVRPRPTGRSPTWPPTASPAPPCSSWASAGLTP